MVLVVIGEKVQGKANQDTDKIRPRKVDQAFMLINHMRAVSLSL